MKNASLYIELLYQALQSKHGISVVCSDVPLARQNFYKARKIAADLDLMSLRIHSSPFRPEDELWLAHAKKRVRTANAA